MIGYLRRGLLVRPGPVVASLAAITAGAMAFILLTAQVAVQRLELRGPTNQVQRGSYDILVRPRNSRTTVEAAQNLVRPNAIADQFGGISLDQVRRISSLPGVEVAAPIAMIGYVLQTVDLPIDITGELSPGQRQLFTADGQRSTDRGLSHYDQPGLGYTYITPDRLTESTPPIGGGPYGVVEHGTSDRLVCPADPSPMPGPFAIGNQRTGICWSRQNGAGGAGSLSLPRAHVGLVVRWTFPFLLAAVDPAAESALVGLDHAVGQGRYLPAAGSSTFPSTSPLTGPVPVLVADRTASDDVESLVISRLSAAAAATFGQGLSPQRIAALIATGDRTPVRRTTITAAQAYQALIQRYLHGSQQALVDNFWTAGPTDYTVLPHGVLAPRPVHNSARVWQSTVRSQGFVAAPPDSAGLQFRGLIPHPAIAAGRQSDQSAPLLRTVGTFDPTQLSASGNGQTALGDYGATAPRGADDRTSRLLGGRPLLSNGDIGGYLDSAPTMLTSLDQLPRFTDTGVFQGVSATAPISAVRVRVTGVSGVTALSRERVRAVAEAIYRHTGLDVAVTFGDASVVERVLLPAGGTRPALLLDETWQREGVVAAVLRSTDDKSVLLAVLVLAVCALFIANATAAAVRVRRPELSLLSCLGWSRRRLLGLLLLELLSLSGAAGLIGIAVVLATNQALGVPVGLGRGLLVLPVAVVTTLVAGVPIAWRATVPPPLFTLPVSTERSWSGSAVRSVVRLALVNLLRRPGRTVTGLVAVAIGAAAVTLLVSISVTFHGSLVGSVLGSATTLQARRVDYLSAAIAVVLAAAAVADAAYFNVRDRRSELAVLAAVGWPDGKVGRLVLTEAVATALLGAVPGALSGGLAAATLAGRFSGQLLAIGALTALGATVVVTVCAWLPLRLLRRWPTSVLVRDY